METPYGRTGSARFTAKEKKTLYGLSTKIAKKRRCSSMYVCHIINGQRGVNTVLAQNILEDLQTLLKVLKPKE